MVAAKPTRYSRHYYWSVVADAVASAVAATWCAVSAADPSAVDNSLRHCDERLRKRANVSYAPDLWPVDYATFSLIAVAFATLRLPPVCRCCAMFVMLPAIDNRTGKYSGGMMEGAEKKKRRLSILTECV